MLRGGHHVDPGDGGRDRPGYGFGGQGQLGALIEAVVGGTEALGLVLICLWGTRVRRNNMLKLN